MVNNEVESSDLAASSSIAKRAFDLFVSICGLVLTGWIILLAWLIASIETRSNGFFTQQRVGRAGKLFPLVKIRTMYKQDQPGTSVTITNDPRISRSGRFFRRSKIDELPQLLNVLLGHMSLVGPRPDVAGFADKLEGAEKAVLLSVRPGITGPATLKYRNEEELLAAVEDPEIHNRDVIFPDKVRINLEYIKNWNFVCDLKYIWRTIAG